MKKSLLSVLLLAAVTLAYAQEAQTVSSSAESGLTEEELKEMGTKVRYIPNAFKDNWELGIALGTDWQANGMFHKTPEGQTKARADMSFAFDISALKWFNPFIGVRLGMIGSFPHWDLESWSEETHYYTEKKLEYDIHADVLWNVSHQATGYKPNRMYNAILYAGIDFLGMPHRIPYPGVSVGLLNSFHIRPNWALNLDLRMTGHRDSYGTRDWNGDEVHGWGGKIALLFGFTYRFNKSEWETVVPVPDKVKQALEDCGKEADLAKQEAQAEKDAADQLRSENDDLRRELATRAEVKMDLTHCDLFFPIDKTVFELTEMNHFHSYLDVVRSCGADLSQVRCNVIGSADKGTGRHAHNVDLAKRRAEYGKQLLIEAGIPATNITTSHEIRESSEAKLDRCVSITFAR